MGNPLLAIRELGQSIWLDNISRELLDSGKLASLIAEDGISGVTSNPTIFEKAIGHSDLYDRSLIAAARDGLDARAIFFRLAFADIRDGADAAARRPTTRPTARTATSRSSCRRSSRATRPARSGGQEHSRGDRPAERVHQGAGDAARASRRSAS